jgi:hypothetical protein
MASRGVIFGGPGDGLQFNDASNVHVHDNVIDKRTAGNKFTIMVGNVDGALFEYNELYGPIATDNDLGGAVMYIGGDCRDVVVRHNDLIGDTNFGIWSHVGNLDVYGNVFANLRSAIYSDGSPGIEVYNNVFYRIGLQPAQYGTPPLQCSGMTARNNIFALDKDPFDGGNTSHNLFTSSRHAEGSDNVVVADPMFVDPTNGDFRLRPASPAIDQGTRVTTSDGIAVDVDRKGTARPQGPAADIGAYEYVDLTSTAPAAPSRLRLL